MLTIRTALALGVLTLSASPVLAQSPYESVGSRALGMAGAFVAVANDVTAAYWNPAGLATGQFYSGTIEWSRFQKRNLDGPPTAGAALASNSFGGVGSLPLALTFGHLTSATLADGPDDLTAHRLSTRHYGVTVLQTVVPGLVVGTTLKYVRGSVATGSAEGLTARETLEALTEGAGHSTGAFDLDVGLMADLERVRLGVAWKNLRTPTFGDVADTATTLPRLARFGLAVLPGAGVTLAMDVDLDTADLPGGLRRMIAFGGESPMGTRAALRGGVRWNLEGSRRPVVAAGASVALRERLWLDAHYSHGHADRDRVFGVALRAGY